MDCIRCKKIVEEDCLFTGFCKKCCGQDLLELKIKREVFDDIKSFIRGNHDRTYCTCCGNIGYYYSNNKRIECRCNWLKEIEKRHLSTSKKEDTKTDVFDSQAKPERTELPLNSIKTGV